MIHYAYQLCTALSNLGTEITLITSKDYELFDFPHNFRVDNRLFLWKLHDPQPIKEFPTNPLGKLWKKIKWTYRRGVRAIRLLRMWVRLTNHLINIKPDLVQFGKINFPFEAFFLRRMQQRGLILTQINHEFERRENEGNFSRWIDKLYNSIFGNFSAIFFHAKENLHRFSKNFNVPEEITHIIPHGNQGFLRILSGRINPPIKLRERYHLRNDEIIVLFFGILTPSKGLTDLIEAFPHVSKNSPAKLLVVGYPSKYVNVNEIRNQISRLNITEKTILDPRYIPLEEIGPLIELANIVVLPYRSSTQSGVLQIAYTFGRPVIATDVGGLPEVVEDGQTGFLVPPRSPAILAEKILALVNNPSLASRMGNYAQHISETRFSWDPISRKILNVYKKILRKKKI